MRYAIVAIDYKYAIGQYLHTDRTAVEIAAELGVHHSSITRALRSRLPAKEYDAIKRKKWSTAAKTRYVREGVRPDPGEIPGVTKSVVGVKK